MPDVDTVKGKQSGPSGKLGIDLSSIPKELQDRAPKTNGEKHFDRTIAVGLFFAIYAASVAGAIIIKKQPWGNKNFYTPIKNFFHEYITGPAYGTSYASEAEWLVKGGEKPVGFIKSAMNWIGKQISPGYIEKTSGVFKSDIEHAEQVSKTIEKILWDLDVAKGSNTIRSANEFSATFEPHRGFLEQVKTALDNKHGLKLGKSIGETLRAPSQSVQETLAQLEASLKPGSSISAVERDAATRLQTILKDYKLDKQTEDLSEIVSLSMGGTAVVLPYKLYDDRRHKAIIQEHDAKYGTGIDDPLMDAAARARVANTATQSWPSALATRFAALGVLVGTAYTPGIGPSIIGVQKKYGAQLMELAPAKKLMEWIGKANLKWYPYQPNDATLQAASAVSKQFTGEMAVADMTWTMYTTSLMLAFGKVFAPMFGNKSAQKKANYLPYQEPQPAQSRGDDDHHHHTPTPRHETPMAMQDGPSTRIQHPQREQMVASAHEHANGV